jgi:RNA polymerase sigma-70 factor (ECF subfamily)
MLDPPLHSPPPRATAQAFAALLPDLGRAARRLVRSPGDAEDLVQETLLRVWVRLAMDRLTEEAPPPITDLRAYAFATLRNCARRRASGPTVISAIAAEDTVKLGADPAHHLAATETLRALAALPPEQQHLLRLRALEGLSYAEIARETGLPLGTVTSRLSRGRKALRAALDLPDEAPLVGMFTPGPGG